MVNTTGGVKSVDGTKGPTFKTWITGDRIREVTRKLYSGSEEMPDFQFGKLVAFFLSYVSLEYLEAVDGRDTNGSRAGMNQPSGTTWD